MWNSIVTSSPGWSAAPEVVQSVRPASGGYPVPARSGELATKGASCTVMCRPFDPRRTFLSLGIPGSIVFTRQSAWSLNPLHVSGYCADRKRCLNVNPFALVGTRIFKRSNTELKVWVDATGGHGGV